MTYEKTRYCSNCWTEKPADTFKKIPLKRGARYMCADCYAQRSKPRDQDARDKFGQEISERNRSRSHLSRQAQLSMERKKTNDV